MRLTRDRTETGISWRPFPGFLCVKLPIHFSKSTGGYIFLDASKVTRGSKAHLISKEFSGASASCLHFWYHMRADKDANGMGYLRVFIQRGKKLRRWQRWARTKNRGKRWLFKKITVNKHKQNQPFRVREGLDSLFKLFKKPLSCILFDSLGKWYKSRVFTW